MKNISKMIGIIALAAVIGFGVAACGGGGGGDDTVVTVTAAGGATSVGKGGTLQFTAAVTGTDNPAQTVTWSIVESGKHAQTAISDSGLLAVNAAETLTKLTIKATSTVNKSKSGTRSVDISATPASLWTEATVEGLDAADRIYAIAWGGATGSEKFVAGTIWGKIATSSDGITWTSTDLSATLGSNFYVDKIVWGGASGAQKFVAANLSEFFYSTDGTNWTKATFSNSNPFNSFPDSINSITWGGAAGNEKFVAVGGGGKTAYSSDGVTWTAVTNPIKQGSFAEKLNGVASNGTNFVTVGTAGVNASWSGNTGINWTVNATKIGTGATMNTVIYGNNMFIAGGLSGKMFTSPTGNNNTWTAVADTKFGTDHINFIVWGGAAGAEKFVAIGTGGKCATSPDGTTWTLITHPHADGPSNNFIDSIAWGNGKFVTGNSKGKIAYWSGNNN